MRILRECMDRPDFIHMRPDRKAAAIPPHPASCYALLQPGETFTVDVTSPRQEAHAQVLLDLPKGR